MENRIVVSAPLSLYPFVFALLDRIVQLGNPPEKEAPFRTPFAAPCSIVQNLNAPIYFISGLVGRRLSYPYPHRGCDRILRFVLST